MPPNLSRKARLKRQTRLTFDPVEPNSSSPATMSPAHVRFEHPNRNKRPTPRSSLQAPADGNSDDEILGEGMKQKLTVQTTPGSGKKNMVKALFKALPTPVKSSQVMVDSSIETLQNEDDTELLSSTRRSAPRSTTKKVPIIDGAGDLSDGSEPEDEPLTPSKKALGKRPARMFPVKEVDPESDVEAKPTRLRGGRSQALSSARTTRSAVAKPVTPEKSRRTTITLSDSSDEEVTLPKFRSSTKSEKSKESASTSKAKKLIATAKSSRKKMKAEMISDDDDNAADSDPIISSPRRSQKLPFKAEKIESDSDSDIRSSPPRRRPKLVIPKEEDDDFKHIVSPLKRSRQASDSEDSDIVASPLKRQRQQPVVDLSSDSDLPSRSQISRGKGKKEQPGRSKSPVTPARATRQRQPRGHRTAKEKQMELLRRRRAGENIDELTESESEEAESEEEFQELDEFDDEEEEDEKPVKSRNSAKAKRQRGDSDEEAGEDDFIVDDDEGPLGIPDHSNMIPLEFTHAAHKLQKEHFKDVVEWMVHNKLNPGFEWDDPVYQQAFIKLDTEYLGYASSKFVSTQWTAEFTRSVYARPILEKTKLAYGEGIDIMGEAKCQPCNHRNHKPSYVLRFSGKAYHKATLEEVEEEKDSEDEEEEEDSEEEEDKASVNSQGQKLPSQERTWCSGNVCAFNAEQAHTLIHWRYHLNVWVIDNLEHEQYLTPEKLVERENMSATKRLRYANKVVDKWEAEKKIKALYRDFKSQIETARELKAQERGGWR